MNDSVKPGLRRYRQGEVVQGASLNLGSPVLCEIAAEWPLDWLILDWEHGLWNESTLPEALKTLAASPMLTIVRVPQADGPWIKKALDWGADGVLAPGIGGLEEARACVREAKYAPIGCRGVGPFRPSGFYSRLHEFVAEANERTLLWLMIEKDSMIAELDAICALDGVDGFMLGRNDLAQSRGCAFADSMEATNALAHQAIATCVAAGQTVGSFRGSPAETAAWIEAGARLVVVGDDVEFLRNGFQASRDQLGLGDRPSP